MSSTALGSDVHGNFIIITHRCCINSLYVEVAQTAWMEGKKTQAPPQPKTPPKQNKQNLGQSINDKAGGKSTKHLTSFKSNHIFP